MKKTLLVNLFALFGFAAAADGGAIAIGSRLEPFVDHYLIDRMDGVELNLHSPQPAETALRFDLPWEGRYCGYVTVIKDGETYRMYYRGLPEAGADGSDQESTCYAESRDGIQWSKPKLRLFEVAASKENNIILKGFATFSHNFSPFLDERPEVPASERYKALAGTSKSGLIAFRSADGIHWEKLQEQPVLTKGAFDSQNVAFWSTPEQCYVCYFRTWTQGDFAGFRTVSRATSTDFVHWTEPVEMDFGNTPREHLYTNQTHPYFRAPHIYVSTAARFMPNRRVVSADMFQSLGGEATYSGDCSDTVLMTSRGGNRYDRTFMEGFIRPGIGLSNWSSRTNYPALGIVPTGPDEISVYVQRNYGQPTHHLQRLTLRTDGLASVKAPYEGGELVTKPFRFEGNCLLLNFSTSAAGGIRCEIQDEQRQPIPGFTLDECIELIGDELERIVSWTEGSDVSRLAGRPIRLRFTMKDADLYAIQFRRTERNLS